MSGLPDKGSEGEAEWERGRGERPWPRDPTREGHRTARIDLGVKGRQAGLIVDKE